MQSPRYVQLPGFDQNGEACFMALASPGPKEEKYRCTTSIVTGAWAAAVAGAHSTRIDWTLLWRNKFLSEKLSFLNYPFPYRFPGVSGTINEGGSWGRSRFFVFVFFYSGSFLPSGSHSPVLWLPAVTMVSMQDAARKSWVHSLPLGRNTFTSPIARFPIGRPFVKCYLPFLLTLPPDTILPHSFLGLGTSG